MKKYFLYGLCITIFTIICVGCGNKNNLDDNKQEDSINVDSNNKIFTSGYFEGLKEIRFLYYDNAYYNKVLTSTDDMQSVCDILASLKLVEKEKEDYLGNLALVLTFDDESEKIIKFTSATLTYEDNAYTPDRDISKEMIALFADSENEE